MFAILSYCTKSMETYTHLSSGNKYNNGKICGSVQQRERRKTEKSISSRKDNEKKKRYFCLFEVSPKKPFCRGQQRRISHFL